MQALNKMYLSAEDARITTMTECKVNLFQRFNQLAIYADTIKNFELEIAEAWSAAYLANQQKEKTESDLELKNEEANQLAGQQSTEMKGENEELSAMEAETSTFRFIMNQVGDVRWRGSPQEGIRFSFLLVSPRERGIVGHGGRDEHVSLHHEPGRGVCFVF